MRRARLLAAVALFAAATSVSPPPAALAGTPVPGAPSCPMLPADNIWNADISALPVHSRSAAWLQSSNAATRRLHPDFGPSFGEQSVPYGIPYTVVGGDHAKTNVTFDYADESDRVPYPFDQSTPIEGGNESTGDRHALMLDRDACRLYELFDARYAPNGGSTAGSGAVYDLRSNALRPAGWTSADAAGLPILPGLLRRDEVLAGEVTHAIRFTVSRTDRSYVWPARHHAGAASDPNLPPMGARFRLRSTFDISRFRPDTQVVLRAMQRYGLILADNGSDWFFSGTAEDGWSTDFLDELKSVPASQLEAVDVSSLQVDPNSGAARPPVDPRPGGYRMVAADGGIFSFGDATFHGSTGALKLAQPIVGMAESFSGNGYWLVARDGGIFAFGDATFHGSTGAIRLAQPVVGMAPTPDGRGYWLVAADGGIFAFGNARFHGSTGAIRLAQPIVAMAATPTGNGYWLFARDGGVFAFGDARFLGSTGNIRLAQPVVGAARNNTGNGYWMVAADGGIFAFGDATFHGSTGDIRLARPVVGMAPRPEGLGYWLVAADGGIFAFGAAPFKGSTGNIRLAQPIVGITA